MNRLRTFPKEATSPGTTKTFLEAYRKAFDADPVATFCFGEYEGVVLVVAVGERAERLKSYIEGQWDGVIQEVPSE